MRHLILMMVISILGTESSVAQIAKTLQNHRASQLDSLKRVLKLSPHLQLQWMTSQNGFDTLRITDDFNRATVGPDWKLDPRFWQIKDGELDLTDAAIYSFRYLAVFLPVYNTPERRIYSVAYRWGRHADAHAITEGSHALMLDRPNENGSGYWLWHRTNWQEVWLWIVKNGTWEYTPGEHKEVDRVTARTRDPQAGDVVTAYIRPKPDAVYFDYYVNNRFDATLSDPTKEYPKSDRWHVGVFLYGWDPDKKKYLTNQVDDFTVTWLEGDVVAPARVNDLQVSASTSTSVTLEWTATGDNAFDGQAAYVDLRYSKTPIDENNFDSAQRVRDVPEPPRAGERQSFAITGLAVHTNYYFALKLLDEADNSGPLSNVTQAQTRGDGVARKLTIVNGRNQSGEVNSILPLPVAAKITDRNGLAVYETPVRFTVLSGNGAIGGKKDTTVNTDLNGEAKLFWRLGTLAGAQKVKIVASALAGFPDTCVAIAKAASPVRLTTVSGNRQIVAVGKIAPEPLVVRLADQYGNLNFDKPVSFQIAAGGGSFTDGFNAIGKFYQTVTNSNGQAWVKVFAGNTYGDTTKITAKWMNSARTVSSATNFIVMASQPDSALIVKGNNQKAARNSVLRDSLSVRIFDNTKAPVKNYPVAFRILSGGGKLANNQTQITLTTDNNGYARTPWKLGNVAGTQEVEVKALFNNRNLHNTPLIFKATAFIPSAIDNATETVLPSQFVLHQNFPNPFWSAAASRAAANTQTAIQFDLPEAGTVEMLVMDMNGRQVRQLVSGMMPAGSHRMVWPGQNDAGRPVESGAYFITLRVRLGRAGREQVVTRKVVLMK